MAELKDLEYLGNNGDLPTYQFNLPIVKVCGKAVNRGGGLGMEVPCEYIFTGPGKLLERLEKCLDLAENPAVRKEPVRSKNNAEVVRGR